MPVAVLCSRRPCARTTKDASGRCHDHRDAPSTPAALTLSTPKTTASIAYGAGHEYEVRNGAFFMLGGPAPEGLIRRTRSATNNKTAKTGPMEVIEYFETPYDEEPVLLVRLDNGRIKETYLRNGKPHRDADLPTTVLRARDGRLIEERWEKATSRGAVLHRTTGPAVIAHHAEGWVVEKTYYRNGELSRLDGPAYESFRTDGDPHAIEYSFEGTTYFESPEVFYLALSTKTPEKLRKHLVGTPLAGVEKGREHEVIAAYRSGVRTPEGIFEVLGGSPAEWVVAYEEGRA